MSQKEIIEMGEIKKDNNSDCYRFGEYIVKISFEETEITLTERIKEILSHSRK